MYKIIFTDENRKYENISGGEYIYCEDIANLSDIPDGIISGGFYSVEAAEKVKKVLIDKKINGAFLTVNPDFAKEREAYDYIDKSYIKKLKEVCLFADMVFLNFTEACEFANLTYKEGLNIKDAETLIFRLNSFGMANKLIIIDFPSADYKSSILVSEYGECEIVEVPSSDYKKEALSVSVLAELIKGEKIKNALLNGYNNIK